MKTKCFSLVLTLLFLLSACGGQQPSVPDDTPETQTVELTVWGAEEDEALLQEIFASFQAQYAGQADFRITYQPQSESSCKDVLLGDLEGGRMYLPLRTIRCPPWPPRAGSTPFQTRTVSAAPISRRQWTPPA